MTLPPLLDRVTSLVAWLADRIGGFCDPAGRAQAGRVQAGREQVGDGQPRHDHAADDQAGRDQPGHPTHAPASAPPTGLTPALAGALLARMHALVARVRAVLASPPPPPPATATATTPAAEPKQVKPRFVPTHNSRFITAADLEPARPRAPSTWAWLVRLLPEAAAGRTQMEELLRDPTTVERLAADPRLGRVLRPLAWMLGVNRKLLPAAPPPRLVFLVPGGRSAAAVAAETYAAARARGVSRADLIALWCRPAAGGRDKRPIWRGTLSLTLPDGTRKPA